MRFKILSLSLAFTVLFPNSAFAEEPQTFHSYIVHLLNGSDVNNLPFVSQNDVKDSYEAALNLHLIRISNLEMPHITSHNAVLGVMPNEALELYSDNYIENATWGLDAIDQKSRLLDDVYTYDENAGQGVYVYVMDTGVDLDHPEFTGRILDGVNTADDTSTRTTSDDCQGHGTHVAGTIAGTTVGVAPKATVIPVRILNCGGGGMISNFVSGLDWVYKNHPEGTKGIINMSFGWNTLSSKIKEFDAAEALITLLKDKGVYSIAAAGNSGKPVCWASGDKFMPAGSNNTIAVGAVGSDFNKPASSNVGECVDIFAPGVDVNSAKMGGGYRLNSGTSMASPHVAGVAARLLSYENLSYNELKNRIIESSTPLSTTTLGEGSPNRMLYMEGDVNVISTEFNVAKDETFTSSVKIAGGDGQHEFQPYLDTNSELNSNGQISVKASDLARQVLIPVIVNSSGKSDTKNITIFQRDRPSLQPAVYNVTRETLSLGASNGSWVRKLVTSGEELTLHQVEGQQLKYGSTIVNSLGGSFQYIRTQDDSVKTWTEDIKFYVKDEYGILSQPANIQINMTCNLSLNNKEISLIGNVGQTITSSPLTFHCGTAPYSLRFPEAVWENANPSSSLSNGELFLTAKFNEIINLRTPIRITDANGYVVSANVNIQVDANESPPGPPVVSVNAISESTLKVDWQMTDSGGSDITKYLVQYRSVSEENWITNEFSENQFDYLITELSASSNYEIRVGATNIFGTTWSNSVFALTMSVAPDAPVLLVGDVSSSSVGLSWTVFADGGSSISDYVLQYRVSGSDAWLTFADGVSVQRFATVTNLQPGVAYEFRVGAFNSVGGTFSTLVPATTDMAEPDAPVLLVGDVSSSSVGLSWTVFADGGSSISDYVLQYRVSGSDAWLTFADGVSVQRFATVTNLQPGVAYEFRVGAFNSVGGTFSTLVPATTSLTKFGVTTFFPSSVAVGAAVGVVGTNLSLVTQVRIGSVVVPFRFVNDELLVITVPAGTFTGSLTLSSLFENLSTGTLTVDSTQLDTPTITALDSYSAVPGSTLIVSGEHIGAASLVKFSGVEVFFTVLDRSSISIMLPTDAINGRVSITTPGGLALSDRNVTLPPRLSTVSLTGARGQDLVLQGENLVDISSVVLNNVAIEPGNRSHTSVIFTVPLNATSGLGSVVGPGGVSSTFSFLVSPSPVLDTFYFAVRTGVSVTLTGDHLLGVNKVLIGGVTATSFTSTSRTVTFTVPPSAKTGKVTVITTAGTVVSLSNLIVLIPPSITTISPTRVRSGTVVTITGFGLKNSKIYLGSQLVKKSLNTSSMVKFKIPKVISKGIHKIRISSEVGQVIRKIKVN